MSLYDIYLVHTLYRYLDKRDEFMWHLLSGACIISIFRKKIDDIAEHITSLNFLAQYAKASEADGHFKKAAQAYQAAHDYENAVRYATYYNRVC